MITKSRIRARFEQLCRDRKCALVTYFTAGDPHGDVAVDIMHSLVRAGSDIIELGVPFSDPMADGPVIQRASERALEQGMNLAGVLDIVAEFRAADTDTPVVLMGYLNPFEAMGYPLFARRAAECGVDGVLIVDAPPEEADAVNDVLRGHGLDQIFLIAPNSTSARIDSVCRYASGFAYYVSIKGVTGSRAVDAQAVNTRIAEIRQRLSLPIGVGFGIKSPASAAALANSADAIIVGSAIIELMERSAHDISAAKDEVESFIRQLRDAIDEARAAAS